MFPLALCFCLCFPYLILLVTGDNGVNATDANNQTEITTSEITEYVSNTPTDKTILLHDPQFVDDNPELSIIGASQDKPFYVGTHKYYLKPLFWNFLQNLNPINLAKPIQEKINRIKNHFLHPNHPAYGGIQFFDPQQIWERFHENGNHFLTGINGAIFGLKPIENHDYPFPYKFSKSIKN